MKRTGTLKVIAALVAVLVIAIPFVSGCLPGQPEAAPAEKILKIGNAVPLSGPAAPWGMQQQVSLEIWVEDVNAAGGIKVGDDYYKVWLIAYDTAWKGATAITVTRKAIYDDGVRFIFAMDVDAVVSTTDIVEESGTISMACAVLGGMLGEERPHTFQTFWNSFEWWWPAVSVYMEQDPDLDTIVLVAPDNIGGREDGEVFWPTAVVGRAEEAGITTLDVVYYEPGAVDFYSMLTTVIAQGTDVIVFATGAPIDQANLIKQARELGYEGGFFGNQVEVEFYTIAGEEAIEGIIAASSPSEALTTPVGVAWAERFVPRIGMLVGWAAGCGYDTANILKAAIEKAGTLDTDKVLEAMGEVEIDGIFGKASFAANDYSEGLARYIQAPYFLVQIQNGKEVVVYEGR